MRKEILCAAALTMAACGGGGGGGSTVNWSGVWQVSMRLHENTCPFQPAIAGLPGVIQQQYDINQSGDAISLTLPGAEGTLGGAPDSSTSFNVNGQTSNALCETGGGNQSLVVQFYDPNGEIAGAAYTVTFFCGTTARCLIGYVGDASRTA